MAKFLTMCAGGNVRSVSLAWALKDVGQEAIAVGHLYTRPETFRLLVAWADYVIVMQESMVALMPADVPESKLRVLDVGEDRFGYATHPELLTIVRPMVASWMRRDFKI